MAIQAGRLALNRRQLNLAPGTNVINTLIQESPNVNTAPDPSLAASLEPGLPSRVMVIPLPPIDRWITGAVSVSVPPTIVDGTVRVTLFNLLQETIFVNVLFWNPATRIGPVSAAAYS